MTYKCPPPHIYWNWKWDDIICWAHQKFEFNVTKQNLELFSEVELGAQVHLLDNNSLYDIMNYSFVVCESQGGLLLNMLASQCMVTDVQVYYLHVVFK